MTKIVHFVIVCLLEYEKDVNMLMDEVIEIFAMQNEKLRHFYGFDRNNNVPMQRRDISILFSDGKLKDKDEVGSNVHGR